MRDQHGYGQDKTTNFGSHSQVLAVHRQNKSNGVTLEKGTPSERERGRLCYRAFPRIKSRTPTPQSGRKSQPPATSQKQFLYRRLVL